MRYFLSVLFLVTTLNVFCQNISCVDFKTGEFKYSNPKYSEWVIKRTDSTQIEISNKTGVKIYSLIEWKSNCEYSLTCKTVTNPNLKHSIGKVFKVIITETFNNRYKCISKRNDVQLKDLELEMLKTK